jgi:hypothetical protein
MGIRPGARGARIMPLIFVATNLHCRVENRF